MGRHRCELQKGRYTRYIVGMTPAAAQPGMGMHGGRIRGHHMRKLNSFRQLRDRMGSNTHELN